MSSFVGCRHLSPAGGRREPASAATARRSAYRGCVHSRIRRDSAHDALVSRQAITSAVAGVSVARAQAGRDGRNVAEATIQRDDHVVAHDDRVRAAAGRLRDQQPELHVRHPGWRRSTTSSFWKSSRHGSSRHGKTRGPSIIAAGECSWLRGEQSGSRRERSSGVIGE